MGNKFKKPGMTLIEILISMALFGILVAIFLNLFSGSLSMIIHSGERAKVKVSAASKMNNVLNDASYSNSSVIKTLAPTPITITYPDGSTASVSGNQITVTETNSNGLSIQVKGFAP